MTLEDKSRDLLSCVKLQCPKKEKFNEPSHEVDLALLLATFLMAFTLLQAHCSIKKKIIANSVTLFYNSFSIDVFLSHYNRQFVGK